MANLARDARALDQTVLISMIESGNYRLEIRKRFLRSAVIVLEERITRKTQNAGALNGIALLETWRPATFSISRRAKVGDLVLSSKTPMQQNFDPQQGTKNNRLLTERDEGLILVGIKNGEYRLARKTRFLRPDIVVLEKKIRAFRGSYNGFDYDDYSVERWVTAKVDVEKRAVLGNLSVAA